MPQQYSGRITVIVFVVLAALWAIFPQPAKLFDSSIPFAQKHDLKPGIDMVGGTSLLYEIKKPEGATYAGELAQDVMQSLKKRVDPDGTRNLIWRPQGGTRLEIQLPLSNKSDQASKARDEFADAQEQLESTNVRVSQASRAAENPDAEARRKEFEILAQGSETRARLLGAMASVADQIRAARDARNAAEQARKEIEYDDLKSQIGSTNLTSAELESILGATGDDRGKRLNELKARFEDFPARVAAIDAYEKAFAAYSQVKGSIEDAADLKRLLKGSGVLEFYIVVNDTLSQEYQAMAQRLAQKGPGVQAGDTMKWVEVERPKEFTPDLMQVYSDRFWALVYTTPEKSMVHREGAPPWALENASVDQSQLGARAVGFRFDPQGAQLFGQLTGANKGNLMAVVLDDKIISAATIQSQIFQQGIISRDDGYSEDELQYLIRTLNAGSLPAQLADEPISERTVGPQLGSDNLRAGMFACAFGLVVVAVFLIGYYYIAGVVATFAVLLNMVLILGSMAALNATFTLPGIAGIVLTIGMAVDANVLIFERLREEQMRGLSLRMALRNAYDRAFSAILDGNVTTGITSAILYIFGSEEVKGFGLTLMIGIVWSLFTALFVTKTIFGLMIDYGGLTKLSSFPLTFPRWDRMLRPNIDWMSKAWMFYAFSIVFLVLGLTAFGVKFAQDQMLDIEFTSGTQVQFELKEPMSIEEVRKLLPASDALPSPTVVSVNNDPRSYEVATPNKDSTVVRETVLEAFGDKLKITLPSKFKEVGVPVDLAIGKSVFPIENADIEMNHFEPLTSERHVGGVAIWLNELEPPISPNEIKSRMEQQRLLPQPGQSTPPYREFDVESEYGRAGAVGGDRPANSVVILVSDPAFPYGEDERKWHDELAGPMWRLVNEAVNREAQLQKVTNFDAQVAGETQRDALVAMTLSILVIMAYIWVRFGNLKYGTATVIALLHDTLFTLAAVGVAHYVADTGFGRALLIEPFRINLTLVAAILTVMGYSMNDTVVVFDRIRENRGKFGNISRKMINDSINQTLSRTLLTGGTTIVTIFVMYVFGGSGVHGFTFCLLVGILVGTYSSIAIAAPILLLGGVPQSENASGRTAAGQLQRARA
jgi:SecD/SecF fusion protein